MSFCTDDKLHILQDITCGLDYLHSLPLVHADLKTQNVLLINAPGSYGYNRDRPTKAKLSDFGLSLLKSDSETSQSGLNQKKCPAGATLRFAAPEVLRGELLSSTEMLKTDIYSMGLVIMELAVEEIPFEDLNVPQLIEQRGRKGVIPVPPEGFTLDRELEDMLHQCWRSSPAQRPNAGQLKKMASRVKAFLEDEE